MKLQTYTANTLVNPISLNQQHMSDNNTMKTQRMKLNNQNPVDLKGEKMLPQKSRAIFKPLLAP